jgi:hypothetical protein
MLLAQLSKQTRGRRPAAGNGRLTATGELDDGVSSDHRIRKMQFDRYTPQVRDPAHDPIRSVEIASR